MALFATYGMIGGILSILYIYILRVSCRLRLEEGNGLVTNPNSSEIRIPLLPCVDFSSFARTFLFAWWNELMDSIISLFAP